MACLGDRSDLFVAARRSRPRDRCRGWDTRRTDPRPGPSGHPPGHRLLKVAQPIAPIRLEKGGRLSGGKVPRMIQMGVSVEHVVGNKIVQCTGRKLPIDVGQLGDKLGSHSCGSPLAFGYLSIVSAMRQGGLTRSWPNDRFSVSFAAFKVETGSTVGAPANGKSPAGHRGERNTGEAGLLRTTKRYTSAASRLEVRVAQSF